MDSRNDNKVERAIDLYRNDKTNKMLLIDVLNSIPSTYKKQSADYLINGIPTTFMNEVDVLITIIELYIRLSDYQSTIPLVSKLMKRTEYHPFSIHYAILANFYTGRNQQVIHLGNNYKTFPESTIFIANSLYLMGDIISAIVKLESSNVSDANTLGHLAIMYLDISEKEMAHVCANKALRQDNNQFEALLTKASLYNVEREFEMAFQLISKLQILQPQNSRVLSLKEQIEHFSRKLYKGNVVAIR